MKGFVFARKLQSLLSNPLVRSSSELLCDLELLVLAEGAEFLLCEEEVALGVSYMPGTGFLRLEEVGSNVSNMPGTEFLRLEEDGPGFSKVNTSSRSSLSDPGDEVRLRFSLRSPFLLSLLLRLDLLLDDEEAVEVSLQEDFRSLGFLKLGIFHDSP